MSTKRSIVCACASALAAMLAAGPGAAQSGDSEPAADEVEVRVVDFSGRPPFRRTIVRRPAESAEFARFEEERAREVPEPGETIWVIDRTGKPPFQRRRVEITAENAVEFARFEEVEDESDASPRRHGPPGKGWVRRFR